MNPVTCFERSLSAKKLHQLVSMILKVMFFYLLGLKSRIFRYSHIIYYIVMLRLIGWFLLLQDMYVFLLLLLLTWSIVMIYLVNEYSKHNAFLVLKAWRSVDK